MANPWDNDPIVQGVGNPPSPAAPWASDPIAAKAPWESDPIVQPVQRGFVEKQITTPLRQGIEQFASGAGAAGAKAYEDRLKIFDQIDAAAKTGGPTAVQAITDLYPDTEIKQYAGLGIAGRGDKQAAIREEYARNIQAGVERTAGAESALAKLPPDEAIQQLQGAKTWGDWGRIIFENPGLLTRTLISSAPSMVQGIAMTPVAGPVGLGMGDMGAEMGSTLVDTMRSAGVDVTDPAAIQAALKDPTLMATARQRMNARGLSVGAFDTLTAGIASKALLPAKAMEKLSGKAGELALQTGVQAAGGAAGEATGQIASQGKITSPTDVLMEAIAEVPGGAVEAATLGAQAGKYKSPDVGPLPASVEDLSKIFEGIGTEIPRDVVQPTTPEAPLTLGPNAELPPESQFQQGMPPIVEERRRTPGIAQQATADFFAKGGQVPEAIVSGKKGYTTPTVSEIPPGDLNISNAGNPQLEAVQRAAVREQQSLAARLAALPGVRGLTVGSARVTGDAKAVALARRASLLNTQANQAKAEGRVDEAKILRTQAAQVLEKATRAGFAYNEPFEHNLDATIREGVTGVARPGAPQPSMTPRLDALTQKPTAPQTKPKTPKRLKLDLSMLPSPQEIEANPNLAPETRDALFRAVKGMSRAKLLDQAGKVNEAEGARQSAERDFNLAMEGGFKPKGLENRTDTQGTQGGAGPRSAFSQDPTVFDNPLVMLEAGLDRAATPQGANLWSMGPTKGLSGAVGFVRSLQKRLLPNLKLIIDTRPDSYFASPGANGSYSGFRGDWGVIWLPESTMNDSTKAATVLSHELGHALIHQHWAQTDTATQQAIYAAFGRHLSTSFGPEATAKQFLNDLHSPVTLAIVNEVYKAQLNQPSVDFLGDSHYASWWSFDEWIAEQTSKWMFTNRRTVTLLDRFFKSLGNAMEKVLRMLGRKLESFAPPQEVKAWLDSLLERRAVGATPLTASGTLDSYRKGVEENARALDMRIPTEVIRWGSLIRNLLNQKGIVPAFRRGEKVYPGRTGDLHVDLLSVYPTFLKEGGYAGVEEGFATRTGKFLTRKEAADLVRPDLPTEAKYIKELHAPTVRWIKELQDVPPPQADTSGLKKLEMFGFPKKMGVQADKWSWMSRVGTHLYQIASNNPHIVGLRNYLESARQWNATKIGMISKSVSRLRTWRKLGKEMGQNLSNFMYDIDSMSYLAPGQNARWPTPSELISLAKQHGLSKAAVQVYMDIRNDFLDVTNRIEAAWVKDAQRTITSPTALGNSLAQIRAEMAMLRSRPYFPHERFGDWTVTVRDSAGKVLYHAQRDTRRTAIAHAKDVGTLFPGGVVSTGKLPANMQVFRGLPPSLLKGMQNRLGLSSAQQKALEGLIFDLSPANSAVKKFKRRKGTPGFSLNAQRAYASYFQHIAGHIARLDHAADMQGGIDEVRDSAKAMRGIYAANDVSKRQGIADWMERHFQYIMNPQNEFQALKSLTFAYHLGFNASSAALNLTQIPMVAYPYMGARFGDLRAMNALRKSSVDLRKLFKLDPKALSQDEIDATKLGVEQLFLEESLAAEIAGYAQGGVLDRMLPGSNTQRATMGLARASGWMFQMVEKINRRITFMSAYRLAKGDPTNKYVKEIVSANPRQYQELLGKGWTPTNAGAFLLARDAVDRSMFEYSAMARPEALRGRKGALFAFWLFRQNYLWFVGNDPGASRALIVLLYTAGIMGLPFAKDLSDLAKLLAGMEGKHFDPEVELRSWIADAVGKEEADIALHGMARSSFGLAWAGDMLGIPVPSVDVSNRLGMGQVVPGVQPLLDPALNFNERIGATALQASGAGYGIPLTVMKALESNDPNTFKMYERMLPAAARNLLRVYRYIEQGETVKSGAQIAEFDITDSVARAELVAQSLGFAPTKVTRQWDMRIAMQDAVKFWSIQRGALFDAFADAQRAKDREGIADAKEAIRRFNADVPDPRLRITSQAILKSLKARARKRAADTAGRAGSKMYEGIATGIRESFP